MCVRRGSHCLMRVTPDMSWSHFVLGEKKCEVCESVCESEWANGSQCKKIAAPNMSWSHLGRALGEVERGGWFSVLKAGWRYAWVHACVCVGGGMWR